MKRASEGEGPSPKRHKQGRMTQAPAATGPKDLTDLRSELIRLEETIIFALIERAQFSSNELVYEADSELCEGLEGTQSFLEFFLCETEKVHSLVRRYTSPDENAFFPDKLPTPLLPPSNSTSILKANRINMNSKVMSLYVKHVVPSICAEGDDGHYGSATTCDIAALQAISKRVHYGKFVAEVKFLEKPEEYTRLIQGKDTVAIMELLTNSKVEEHILERMREKASTYGQEIGGQSGAKRYKLDPSVPARIYKDFLIPLTKEIEVVYLMQRLGTDYMVAMPELQSHVATQAAEQYFGGQVVRPVKCATAKDVATTVLSNQASNGLIMMDSADAVVTAQTKDVLFTTEAKVCGEVTVDGIRFLVLGHDYTHLARSGSDHCFVVFAVSHVAGALASTLGAFASNKCNLISIESRMVGRPSSQPAAHFLVELEGHPSDAAVAASLRSIEAFTSFVRVVGATVP